MKKIILSLAALCCTIALQAENVWTGSHAVSWDNTITIAADKFANAQVGDLMTLSFTATEADVIELKSDGKRLAGTRFHQFYPDQTKMETYITADMLNVLKATGLEICGNKFTATSVDFDNVGYNMPDGAIWAGWFWCDDWKTLELWKEAFDKYNGQRYLVVNFSEESYDYEYEFNIISTWEKGAFSNASNTSYEKTRIVLDTQKLEGGLTAAIESNDRVMFQGNCRTEGKGFNITSIILSDSDPTAISKIEAQKRTDDNRYYNLNGQQIAKPTHGICIHNGKKIVVAGE
ncbi:MAG: hypothetical protein HUK08_01750 [Bacteroidaceae bacterium]|nr:hypothetical protein [Bacteroidaceae bacterium]